MRTFVDVLWMFFSTVVFVAYLMVVFQIVVDLFRNPQLGGIAKMLWVMGLIFLPVVSTLLYVVTQGKGMTERQRTAPQSTRADPTSPPAEQISRAKSLLDAGTIDRNEFLILKGKALA